MNVHKKSRYVIIRFLTLALALPLLLAACERPLQNITDGPSSPTSMAPADPTAQDADPTAPAATAEPTTQQPAEPTPTMQSPATPAATETPTEDQSPRPGDEGDDEEEVAGDEEETEATPEATAEATPEATAEATPEPTAEPTAVPTGEPPRSGEDRLHTVQPGENLYRIGLQYGISWSVLAEYNDIANPNRLLVGQQIRIPATGEGESPAPEVTHVVQPGETLFIISQQYGVVWTDIAAANNLTAPYTIHAGQTLVIPGGQ